MPRIRSIKPELPSSKKLARVSRDARYTLMLLVTQADDEGFVLAESRQLLGALYPHDEDVTPELLNHWIDELASINSVAIRETTEGARVLQLVGWHEHQMVKHPGKPKISPRLLPVSPDSPASEWRNVVAEVRKFGDSEEGYSDVVVGAVSGGCAERFEDAAHRAAYDAYRRKHRMPDGFDATLVSVHEPPSGGEAFAWPIIGQSLVEMRGASADFSAAALRAFCRRLLRGDLPPAGSDTDRASARRRALALAATHDRKERAS